MAVCYIVSRAIVLQGGWPLFYIEWGWCWWTIIILISTTLWRLVCSFSHCWHSYLRLSDSALRHRKPPSKLWPVSGWWFYYNLVEVNPLVGGCSFYVFNIVYPSERYKGYSDFTIESRYVLWWSSEGRFLKTSSSIIRFVQSFVNISPSNRVTLMKSGNL